MTAQFHLSIGVQSIEESAKFFIEVLGAEVKREYPNNDGLNIELFGSQVFLKENPTASPNIPDFHYGFNLKATEFQQLVDRLANYDFEGVVMQPKVVDAGTSSERTKMYLKDPTGYLIEFKSYKNSN